MSKSGFIPVVFADGSTEIYRTLSKFRAATNGKQVEYTACLTRKDAQKWFRKLFRERLAVNAVMEAHYIRLQIGAGGCPFKTLQGFVWSQLSLKTKAPNHGWHIAGGLVVTAMNAIYGPRGTEWHIFYKGRIPWLKSGPADPQSD